MLKIYDVRHGRLAHYAGDTTIGLSLAQYGEWAEAEIYLLSRHVKRGDTVLDIGANVGTHSLAFSRIVGPQGRVISFDGQHRIFQVLSMNMLMNGRMNVDCVNALVGSSVSVETVSVIDPSGSINFGAVSFRPGGAGRSQGPKQLPVAMITVDSLALDSCALMKVDVEGMEIDVFRGALATIVRCEPLIYFEQVGDRNFDQIWRFFFDLDYDLFWHIANPFNSNNFRNNSQNFFGGAVEVNVIAIPRVSTELVQRLGVAATKIDRPVFNPVIPSNAVEGWDLPEGAYSDLEEKGDTSLNVDTDPKQALANAYGALRDLQLKFDALAEDRTRAQVIMEHQLKEIERLKFLQTRS